MQALSMVMVRCAIQLRIVHLAFLASSIAVWSGWYRWNPAAAVGAAVMFAWGVLCLFLLHRSLVAARRAGTCRWPEDVDDAPTDGVGEAGEARPDVDDVVRISPVLAGMDVAVAVGAAALAAWIVPDPVRGDPSSLVFIGALTAAVTSAFTLPRRAFVAAVVLLCGVHLATGVHQRPQIFAATMILLVISVLLRYATSRLWRVAGGADTRHQQASARRRRVLLAEGRERDALENERLLHDTILNTLTGIGMSEDLPAEPLRDQCARSVREVEDHLRGRRGPDRTDGSGDPSGPGVADRIIRTVHQARATGLHVVLEGVAPARGVAAVAVVATAAKEAAQAADAAQASVPDEVAAAIAAATGEALRNVRRHAGTDDARVVTNIGPGRLRVSVIDRGRGFRPDDVAADGARLGLRNSVSARMRAVGGEASIVSRPGWGTEIVLSWEAPAPTRADAPAAAAAVDRIEEELGVTARRGFAVAVVVGWLAAFVPVILHRDQARSFPASLGIWLVTFVAIVVTARISARRSLRPAQAFGAVLFAVASAVAGALNTREPGGEVVVCWATTMVNPLWVAFAMLTRRRCERYAAASVAAVAMTVIVLSLGGRDDQLALARLGGAVYALVMLQVLVTMFGPVLRASAQERARAEELAAGVADRRMLDRTLRRDRELRLAQLDARFLPLLRDIAAGRLDPTAPEVRARCTARARALRRELIGEGTDELRDLAGPIEQAEARGVAVTVQTDGLFSVIPPAVSGEFLARVSAVLASVGRGTVLLTGYLHANRADVYLTYPARAVTAPGRGAGRPATLGDFGRAGAFGAAGAGLVRSSGSMADGVVCVELHWSAAQAPVPDPAQDADAPAIPSSMGGLRGVVRAEDRSAGEPRTA
ncbi:Signal transduction histidine kinase [Frankia sp. AiPs1]|uniref:sensor histidine kinase n=1 Tax=Frankia sp. AiPa1 TaxID=573492 RepID=UPI00202B5FA9|nr:ATP-binding protein [Frankia sp. AiPa1]MCL9761491.1 ATP-binding protein [Frankia sp. AiPa1]